MLGNLDRIVSRVQHLVPVATNGINFYFHSICLYFFNGSGFSPVCNGPQYQKLSVINVEFIRCVFYVDINDCYSTLQTYSNSEIGLGIIHVWLYILHSPQVLHTLNAVSNERGAVNHLAWWGGI